MKKLGFCIFLSLMVISLQSYAQIKVEDSGGVTVKKEVASPTTLYLIGDSKEDKIPIYSILSESQAVGATIGTTSGGSTYSGTTSAYGQQVQRLCETPCKLKLDPGVYSLRIGDNLMLGKKLDLTVSGGELAYKVYPGSPGAFIVGTLCFVFGIAVFLPVGALDLAFDSRMLGATTDIILLGSSAALTVLGIVLWAGPSFGSAENISPEVAKSQFAR